ncbi:zinc finger protein 91-like isoform X2 [Oncorhynchus keta]|uniref:zinc finger protein 91-like isoform X2 n=1 Tax=Oncorhynchus keta TaxID=8018 RepID=UPI00227C348A|nr:zinc finger protein 91-like isoform X2 [Oncorhynchus keta]
MQKRHRMEALRDGLPLPLSSLRLLVPPLRLVSAALWQVVQQRDIMDYGLVEEFVTTVLEIVPDMMSYRERVQLIMGLRAQLVLELCRSDHLANPETIQPHLNRMKTCIITHRGKEISDPEVEATESNFLKLIQTLLEDPVEKEYFFQSVFSEEFGPKYNSALQTLVWEFLSRLEKLLPAPTLQQMASWFLPDPSVLEECVQCVSHPQPLKTLLQHHNNTCGHVDTNGLFSGDNQIPIEADPEVQSEPVQQCMSHVSSDNESDMTPLLELGIDSDRTVHKGVEPVHKGVEPVHKVVESASLELGHIYNGTTEKNIKHDTPDKEPAKYMQNNTYFHHLNTDSGLKIQGKAHSNQQEVQDISSLSTSCRLHQPTVQLHRLDIADMLLPVTEVYSTQRRERLQIDKVGSQGWRRGPVVSQKSERNINEEPSDGQPQYSLAPDPSLTTGQPKRSKRVKICSLCGKTFSEAKDLTAHMRCHNEQSPSKCTQCGQDFEHHEDLQKHQQNVCEAAAQPEEDNMSTASVEDQTELACTELAESSKARTCHVCHKTVYCRNYLRKHLKSQHGQLLKIHKKHKTFFCCSLCNKTFGCRNYLRKHLESKHRQLLKMHKKHKNIICCIMCNKSFHLSEPNKCEVNQQQLLRKAHPEANTLIAAVIPQPSSTTSQNPTTSNALPIQAQFYNDYRTCLLCNETFDTAETMRKHLRFQHNILSYLCHDCGESFPSKLDLQKHSKNCLSIPDSRKCNECRKITPQTTQPQANICQEMNQRQQQLPAGGNEMEIPQSCNTDVNSLNDLQQCQPNECEKIHFHGGQQDWSEAVDLNQHPEEVDPNQHPEEVDPNQHPGEVYPNQHPGEVYPNQHPGEVYPNQHPGEVDPNQHPGEVDPNQHPEAVYPNQHPGEVDPNQHPGEVDLEEVDPADRSSSPIPRENGTDIPQSHSTSPQNPTTFDAPPTQTQPPGISPPASLKSRTCPLCSKCFAYKKTMMQHLRRHSQGQGPFMCTICSKSFGTASDLKRHRGIKSGCGPNHRNLVVPENVPTEQKTVFSCPHCQGQYTSENKMKAHMVCHTGDGFTCRFCGKIFAEDKKLRNHVRSHIDRRHLCDTCGKDFTSLSNLKKHTLVHTGEQPYICPDCGKSFSLKGNLKVHQQSHTGERPFACTMCKIRCFTQTHLKRHMLRHTGEKPHKCLACGKTFQRKNTLRKHQQDSCS